MKSADTEFLHDYPPEAYALLSESEKRHFWFQGRNMVIRSIIKSSFPGHKGKRFLEVGCGTGYVLAALARMGFVVTGLDMHPEGLAYARRRVPKAALMTKSLANFRPKTLFDAVGAFDVIEHIAEDSKALSQCAKLLRKGGMLYLTVPARPELWSVYDDISGHKRRYTISALASLVRQSGYDIVYIGYFGFFQYLPHLLMKRFMLKRDNHDVMSVLRKVVWQPPGMLNWLLEKSFALDMYISRFVPLPWGTSLIVAAQKAI